MIEEPPKEPFSSPDIRGRPVKCKRESKREQGYAKGKGVRKQSHHAPEPPNLTKTPEVKVCRKPSDVQNQKKAIKNVQPKPKPKVVKESNVSASTKVSTTVQTNTSPPNNYSR